MLYYINAVSESKETTPYSPLFVTHFGHPDAESGMENAPQQALDTGYPEDDEGSVDFISILVVYARWSC